MTEKRKYTRIPFRVQGSLVLNGREIPIDLLDLSLRGALIADVPGVSLPLGKPIDVDIRDESLRIRITGVPVSRTSNGTGIKWTYVGEKSLHNLYIAVKQGALDKAGIEKEFRSMILKPTQ